MNAADSEPCERGLRLAALGGDAAAWRSLYDSAFDTVSRYARWRCGRGDLADDAIQETWLTAARRLRSFDPGRGRFAEWVCGIAANVARGLVRKRLKSAVQSLVSVPEPAGSECESTSDPERVALALAALPEHYEAALRAKYFEQRSVAEMAGGESLKAVESLLTRARQAFREAYERRGGNHD
jgi:RNA polymerase sigma-70 factor (ECF subfamily)